MITIYRYILLFMLLGFLGCSEQVDQSMIVGKYIANHKKGIDTLELKADGTYTFYYKSADGTELTNTNRWEFEYQNKEPRITFEKFIFGLPNFGSKEPGFWNVKVEMSGKTPRLCIDPDLNYYYEKQK
jgi:hypothetical protein